MDLTGSRGAWYVGEMLSVERQCFILTILSDFGMWAEEILPFLQLFKKKTNQYLHLGPVLTEF